MATRAAILTLDELRAEVRKLEAMAEGYEIVGDYDASKRCSKRAAQNMGAAEHFRKTEGL